MSSVHPPGPVAVSAPAKALAALASVEPTGHSQPPLSERSLAAALARSGPVPRASRDELVSQSFDPVSLTATSSLGHSSGPSSRDDHHVVGYSNRHTSRLHGHSGGATTTTLCLPRLRPLSGFLHVRTGAFVSHSGGLKAEPVYLRCWCALLGPLLFVGAG
jgi:hypothetical protein